MAALSGQGDALLLSLAWSFVALRAVHSLIHCSYNRVMHRFVAYLLGGLCLWALLGTLAWRLV